MSWQLGAFTILALAIAAGFAWYERTRPDARIIALVGTLAAFAALGRIAFAALPNVKPTTDIVLISGYALGGAPGFVVGAVAGLSSNFFFGQGPWTPWQMAAWGATGVIGAGLAVITARRANRVVLALVCGVVGFAFTAFQDVGDWVTYSDHSLSQLGVYVGKGVGFDLVHAVGCVAFALAFGPSLARSLARFAARLQVRWLPPDLALLPMIAIGLAITWGAALAASSPARAAGTPTGYLLSAQNADGGFGSAPGSSSSELFSGWAALGLAAEGYNPQDVNHGGQSLLDYINQGASSQTDPGSIERTILVLRAAGLPAGSMVAALERDIGRDGSVSNQVNLTSFAILALRAAGVAPSSATINWLIRQEDSDGGFNFATRGGGSDVDDTGAALEALAGTGGNVAARAARFVNGQENSDGGYPSQPDGPSNAQSTAWAVQGLLAAGTSIGSLGRPLSYLRSLIASDGHVRYSSSTDQTPVWVTAEALMALAGKPLPLAPVTSAPAAHATAVVHHRSTPRVTKAARRKRKVARTRPRTSRLLHKLALEIALADALVLAPVR